VNAVQEGDGIVGSTDLDGNLFDTAEDVDGDDLDVVAIDGQIDGSIGVLGTYGALRWDAESGDYVYSLDDTIPAVQALVGGE